MSQLQVNEASAKYIVQKKRPAQSNAAESLITQHLNLWSSAIASKNTTGRGSNKKIELYGIKKLRELILELAVRGKLVPQDPNDEPANELLERIEKKKNKLIEEKKLKVQKKAELYENPIQASDLPEGWIAADFGDITFNRDAERIPLSVAQRQQRQGEYDYYGASGVIDSIDGYLFDKPLLLIGEDGANLVSRSTPIAFLAEGKYWVNNHAHVIDGITKDLLAYLSLYINSISLLPYITGMAQPKMNQAKMNSILVLVPPEAEQKRILNKVDELMALCDQLENQTEQSLDAHATLADTLLDALTQAQSYTELMENWQRLEQNWDILFPSNIAGQRAIDKLKQTILQLAVMGKLVPQDPNDEPASQLLKRIAAEKAQLVKDKKIKKQKPLPPITDEEKPFELPEGWEWVRLGSIIHISSGQGLTAANMNSNGEIPVFGGNGITGRHDSGNVSKRTLVIGRVGYYCGSVHITPQRAWVTDNAFVTTFSETEINIDFLAWLLKATDLNKEDSATAQPVISGRKIYPIVVPLPPLSQQKLILDKLLELHELCDQLKQRLQIAQQTQQQFTDAVVSSALSYSTADNNLGEL